MGLLGAVCLALLGWCTFNYLLTRRAPGQFFDSHGVRIFYTMEGAGPPVILVHGLGVNADLNWRRPGVIAGLRDAYTVITLDNRGHGLSAKPHDPAQYGVEMVEDVVRLMDHLKLPKAHVVGYSMGGFITLKLATTHPERLLSASPCAAGWALGGEREEDLLALAESLHAKRGFSPLLRLLDPEGTPPLFQSWFIDFALRKLNDQEAVACCISQFGTFLVPEDALRHNKVPVLTVVGSIDPLRLGIERMRGVMANQQIVVVEGGDHITTMSDKRFIRAIRDFLDRQSAIQSGTTPAVA